MIGFMAQDWLSVTVELLGGPREDVWPRPARVLAVSPSHTFAELATAISVGFGRWSTPQPGGFTLPDGRTQDVDDSAVAELLSRGAVFRFVDSAGGWTHACTIADLPIDPRDVLGGEPDTPTPYQGWGTIPDPFGRRWLDYEETIEMPPRPAGTHPMFSPDWPAVDTSDPVDHREVRGAVYMKDIDRFLAAVLGRDVTPALQHVGSGVVLALRAGRDAAEPIARAVIDGLTDREGPGDAILAEDLQALLRGEPLPGKVVPVQLDELEYTLHSNSREWTYGFIDLHTGAVRDGGATDPGMVGEDAAIDVDEDIDRWLMFDKVSSREGWKDMAAFAEQQRDADVRQRMEHALEGRGAFRRFRDLVSDEGLLDEWRTFSDERKIGHAREFLAYKGIRVG